MNRSWTDQIKQKGESVTGYWKGLSSKRKWIIIGTFALIVVSLSVFVYVASRPQYVPLYSGQLTQEEVGSIKTELEKEGFTNYQISQNGTMLLVPQKEAADLVVTLASKGYPKNSSINYDVFSSNLSFGATERQYDILERQAMQTQVAEILKHVDGIKDANVILTLPSNSVFVSQSNQEKATASVMVKVAEGTQLSSGQVRALYTLVSHSVPNLPVENITIVNQYSKELALDSTGEDDDEISLTKYEQQQKVQQDVQRGIQQSLQNLLGSVLGSENVNVQAFVRMNFDKVKTQEDLVEPVVDGKGIPISSEENSVIQKGIDETAGGVVGTGTDDVVPSYPAEESDEDVLYEEKNSKINYEVNRIRNEITKSPYQIEDISVSVGVQPDDPKTNQLSEETLKNIKSIVSNTVLTALGHPEDLTADEIDNRVTVFPQKFADSPFTETSGIQKSWYLVGGAILVILLLVALLIWLLSRKRRREEELEDAYEPLLQTSGVAIPEVEYFAEQELSVEKQLEKLLHQRPEDFSKIIRTWLNDEEV